MSMGTTVHRFGHWGDFQGQFLAYHLSHPLPTRDVSVAFQSSLEGGAAKHLSVAIATHLAAVNRRPGSSWGGGKRNKRDEGMFRKDLDSIS